MIDDDEYVVQILHTSDLHGKFINFDYSSNSPTNTGGLAAISTKISELRLQYPHTVLIDTGDTVQDNSNEIFISTPTENPMVLVMNALKYDSWTAGNHEFNFGMDYLKAVSAAMDAPTLAANLYTCDSNQRLFKPYIIIKRGAIRIAIIGITTPNIKRWDAENIIGYRVTMPLEEMSTIWMELEGKADIYVLANHLSMNDEYQKNDGFKAIMLNYPGAHVALVSHGHALINEKVGSVVAVEPTAHGDYLNQIMITLKKNNQTQGYMVKSMSATNIKMENIPDDPKMVNLTKKAHIKAYNDGKTIIGRLVGGSLVKANEVVGVPEAQVQMSALVSLINEVQLYYSGADVSSTALFRADANLMAGDITKAGVSFIYKFDNTLRSYIMSGEQLKRYMEWSASYFNQFKEGDLTISFNPQIRMYNYDMFAGVFYDIDISCPRGERIKNLRWPDGRVVKDRDDLIIALNDYRGKSTLANDIFPHDKLTLYQDLFETMGDDSRIRTLIMQYIKDVKDGIIDNSINYSISNYTIIGYEWDEKIRAKAVELINKKIITLPVSGDRRTPNVRSLTTRDLLSWL